MAQTKKPVRMKDVHRFDYYEYITQKDLEGKPFTILHARKRMGQRDKPEVGYIIEVAGVEGRRELTLEANAYRMNFVEHFNEGGGPLGPLVLRKISDPSKRATEVGASVWRFFDQEDDPGEGATIDKVSGPTDDVPF